MQLLGDSPTGDSYDITSLFFILRLSRLYHLFFPFTPLHSHTPSMLLFSLLEASSRPAVQPSRCLPCLNFPLLPEDARAPLSHLFLFLAVVLLAASCLFDCQHLFTVAMGTFPLWLSRVPTIEHVFDSE